MNYPEEEKILNICGFGECMRGYFEAVTPDICFIGRDDVNKMNSIVIQWGIDYPLKGGVSAKGRQYLIETKGKDDVYEKMARALAMLSHVLEMYSGDGGQSFQDFVLLKTDDHFVLVGRDPFYVARFLSSLDAGMASQIQIREIGCIYL